MTRHVLVAVTLSVTLSGCSTFGYQSATLDLPRDEAMQLLGAAHQACRDGKLPVRACELADGLVAQAAKGRGLDAGALIGFLGQILPLAVQGAALLP